MKTINVNGTTLAYHEAGSGSETVLLLHGGMVSHTEWKPQLEAFTAKYHIIAPDLRGHGQSGKTGRPYTVVQLTTDVVGLLDSLEIERVAVVGHSLGGMVAQEMTLLHPERVSALVLAETTYGMRSTWYESLLTSFTEPFVRFMDAKWQSELSAMQLGQFSPDVEAYIREETNALSSDPENIEAIWQAAAEYASKDYLHQINVPTLIVVSAFNIQTQTQGTTMAQLIKGARLVTIEHAGHMLNWDNPTQFNTEVLEFLEQSK